MNKIVCSRRVSCIPHSLAAFFELLINSQMSHKLRCQDISRIIKRFDLTAERRVIWSRIKQPGLVTDFSTLVQRKLFRIFFFLLFLNLSVRFSQQIIRARRFRPLIQRRLCICRKASPARPPPRTPSLYQISFIVFVCSISS